MILVLLASVLCGAGPALPQEWIAATDESRVKREGKWRPHRHRYAATGSLASHTDGSALELVFQGRELVLRLGMPTLPNYGGPERGKIEVSIDGHEPITVVPRASAREVVLVRGLTAGEHRARIIHRADEDGTGCRIEGFRVLAAPSGDLAFTLSGENNDVLVDARAVLRREGKIVREGLVRNWMTGQCRMAGLPPGGGYSLELRAMGWKRWRRDGIEIRPGRETVLGPVYLVREIEASAARFKFPGPGRAAVRRPGGSFRLRFHGYRAAIGGVRIVRRVGPAVISRTCGFREDPGAGFYYFREGVATLPEDAPPGIYDLEVDLQYGKATGKRISRRSVHVVADFPKDPVFLSFGHLDTLGQNQAEYLDRLAVMANLIGVDMVLNANEVNPAYASGALARLEVPYVVTFGNHQAPGHERWYGPQIGVVDFGPGLCVLNFGYAWDHDLSEAETLLSARKSVACKIINTFEQNAPVAFLDRHRIRLLHDGHGTEKKVMEKGATPTLRVGKVNSRSFRLLRFKGPRPVSVTYKGDEVAPIPFGREARPPVRVRFEPANDGSHATVAAEVTNDLEEDLPRCRVTFLLPAGRTRAEGGRVEHAVTSDDGRYRIVSVRLAVPANATRTVTVRP